MNDMKGKVALVTGASKPNGIGYAIAMTLAGHGADVVISDRGRQYEEHPGYPKIGTSEDMDALVAEIEKLGVRSMAVPADVTDSESVGKLAQAIEKEFGALDILCNNAGGSPGPNAVENMDEQNWMNIIDINLNGPFRVSKAMIPLLKKGKPGACIVNTSSRAGKVASAFMGAYCASKAGLISLTKVLALELAPNQIRVNAVCPGQIQTDLGQWGWNMRAFAGGMNAEQSMQQMLKTIPAGRVGTPQDVADQVYFLASDKATFMTGQALNITGGQLMEL